jgi:hypothetical protein
MGRKGVSKRKPKKSGPVSGANISGSSNGQSPVQSLVNDRSTSINRDGMKNPSTGWNKTQKKR